MRKAVCLALILMIFSSVCLAENWEYYLEPKIKVPLNKESGLYFNVKEESRFKDGANYYDKTSLGISKKLAAGLDLAFYGAVADGQQAGQWKYSYIIWPELSGRRKLGNNDLAANTKLEYFTSDGTWHLREQLSLVFPVNNQLSLWLGDEPRIFSLFNGPYFGENEALAGFIYNLSEELSLNVFYDLRSVKQNSAWDNTNCLRTAVNYTL